MPFKTAEAKRAYQQANKEKYAAYKRKYRLLYPEKEKQYKRKRNKTIWYHYDSYKYGAKTRNLEFNISKEDFLLFQNSNCYYCGGISRGIDRVDNNLGYIKDNIVPCCTFCNIMKRHHTKEEFINQCKLIAERN